ncbi:hypothetical protein K5P26_04205 [Sphingopyxis sp. XHP0097]|uniref:Calcium-binding protein n=1 Tax=Sphingopyxis jiangsuensis TaxID=2871171 RepID=A0ABS7MBK0_9SPHN|nr:MULTISPECIES: DUF5694 domain-containing protein [Sphingopyxis]MBY4636343.1 hypothetical protein [Sphingopyxis jiangsuensis]
MRFRAIFTSMLAGLLSVATGASAHAAEDQSIEVMVLGTYHFANPGLDVINVEAADVLAPARQRQLEALADALAEWKPDRIMLEAQADGPDFHWARYTSFDLAQLKRERNEHYQIGFRLAHRLGHRVVYGIDEQPAEGEPDYFPFGRVAAYAEANAESAKLAEIVAHTQRLAGGIATDNILDALAAHNDPAVYAIGNFYYEVLPLGDGTMQPGAELNAYWYMRNAKIFAKLMAVAKPGERILVIFGAGHNYWLTHFAGATKGYRAVDPLPLIADAKSRIEPVPDLD